LAQVVQLFSLAKTETTLVVIRHELQPRCADSQFQ